MTWQSLDMDLPLHALPFNCRILDACGGSAAALQAHHVLAIGQTSTISSGSQLIKAAIIVNPDVLQVINIKFKTQIVFYLRRLRLISLSYNNSHPHPPWSLAWVLSVAQGLRCCGCRGDNGYLSWSPFVDRNTKELWMDDMTNRDTLATRLFGGTRGRGQLPDKLFW